MLLKYTYSHEYINIYIYAYKKKFVASKSFYWLFIDVPLIAETCERPCCQKNAKKCCSACHVIAYCSQNCEDLDKHAHKNECHLVKIRMITRRGISKKVYFQHMPMMLLSGKCLAEIYPAAQFEVTKKMVSTNKNSALRIDFFWYRKLNSFSAMQEVISDVDHCSHRIMMIFVACSSYLWFFIGKILFTYIHTKINTYIKDFRRPNLITGLSSWRVPN